MLLNGIDEMEVYSDKGEWMQSQMSHIYWILWGASSGSKTPHSAPLWFLPCIFIAYIYFYGVLKLHKREYQIIVCTIGLFSVELIRTNVAIKYFGTTLPWHIETAIVGAVLMYLGHMIRELDILSKIRDNIALIGWAVTIGFYCLYMNWGEVALAGASIGEPIYFVLQSFLIPIVIVLFSEKISTSRLGGFFAYLGNASIIAMGFNYYLNRHSAFFWRENPWLSNFEFTWWMKVIVVIAEICLMSCIWNKIKGVFKQICIYQKENKKYGNEYSR